MALRGGTLCRRGHLLLHADCPPEQPEPKVLQLSICHDVGVPGSQPIGMVQQLRATLRVVKTLPPR